MKYARLKIVGILSLFVGGLALQHFALRTKAETQWENESRLYSQGYIDGKKEVLDSLKTIK